MVLQNPSDRLEAVRHHREAHARKSLAETNGIGFRTDGYTIETTQIGPSKCPVFLRLRGGHGCRSSIVQIVVNIHQALEGSRIIIVEVEDTEWPICRWPAQKRQGQRR